MKGKQKMKQSTPLSPRRKRKIHFRRFTIVELLVVIAVIAMLASILLPALGKARDKARAISCTSNRKQLLTTTIMYSNDNNGYLPYDGGGDNNGDSSRQTYKWGDMIYFYATNEKPGQYQYRYLQSVPGGSGADNRKYQHAIQRCPAAEEPFDIKKRTQHVGSNAWMMPYNSASFYFKNYFIGLCRRPSERMLYIDLTNHSDQGGYGDQITWIHLATSHVPNYLHPGLTATAGFVDGHVGSIKSNQVPTVWGDVRFWGHEGK